MKFALRFPRFLAVAVLAAAASTTSLRAADQDPATIPLPVPPTLPPTATDVPPVVTNANGKKTTSKMTDSSGNALPRYEQNLPRGYQTGKLTLTLDQAVQLALKQNPDILKALQQIQLTKGQIFQVAAAGLPQLIGTGNYVNTDNKLLTVGTTGSTAPIFVPLVSSTGIPTGQVLNLNSLAGGNTSVNNTYFLTVQLKQQIYNGGATFAAIRGAKLTTENAYYALRETVELVVNNVKTQFANVLQNEALITIQEQQVALLASQLQDQQNRFAAGTVPRFDVLQAEVALANQYPQLITAQNNYRIAQLTLAQTLGYDYTPDRSERPAFRLIGRLDVVPFNINIADAVAIAEAYRPTLRQARLAIKIAQENVRGQRAGYLPTINATANYQLENDRRTRDLTKTDNGYLLGGNITWNFWDGGLTYGNVRVARAQLLQAAVTYEDTRRSIGLAVQDALSRLRQARELVNSQQKNIGQAEEAVRLSRARLSAGAGTQLDVLNAQVQLAQAQTTELQARFSYVVALADLRRVTGTSAVYVENFTDPVIRKALRYNAPQNPLVLKYANKGRLKPLPQKIDAEHPTYQIPPLPGTPPLPVPPTGPTGGK